MATELASGQSNWSCAELGSAGQCLTFGTQLHMQQNSAAAAVTEATVPSFRPLAPTRMLNSSANLASFGGFAGAAELLPLTRFAASHLIEPIRAFESKLNYYTDEFWSETGDERTNRLPLISHGPWKLLYATLAYLYLIKWLLPKMMRSHKPFELNWPIRVYNLLMVLSNMWAFYHGARILSFGLKCFGCETINHRDYSPAAIELLHYGWMFFLSRLVEWLDTIFFVLRKKDKQVTKLHVFHHSFVPLISWTYLKYHPGYTMAFFPFVNSFVHSIMYTYYLLATFGPQLQPYLWWKRYLTSLQIAQFVMILIQLASIPLTADDKCQYPRGFLYVAFAGAILFLWLFYTYYIETYSYMRQRRPNGRQEKQQPGKMRSNSSDEGKQQLAETRWPMEREGTSRSLADAIENSIGPLTNEFKNENRSSVKKII